MLKAAEYDLLREAVGLAERSARGKLRLTGAEAAEFLQGQVTNDVEGLAPGAGCYAALLSHKGKVQLDMRILRDDDWIWIDTEPGFEAALERTVRTFGIGRDVRAEDVTGSFSILSLLGPAARAALEAEPPAEEHAFVQGEHGLYVATDLGVDVICGAADADAVKVALGVEPVSDDAAECLRVESGRPRFGIDFDTDTIPEEAGLNDRAVSFTKGCYVGQETVARLHYRGKPNRHLRGLRLSEPVPGGSELRLGDRVVGRVGSVAVSPAHGPIALALVRREAAPGDELAAGDSGATAAVVEPPFRVT
ncbi:MAG TPA: glycine cleavage T C-terminal barrel domain-containing protein [Thermoleophilaceae bacterium]|nr:glycine cleavage T C-terminal barrel domain-containing protein [Thermoleophilaceae bacterium]